MIHRQGVFLIMLLRCVIVYILFQNKCRDYILYFKIDNYSFAKISSLCNEYPSERGFQPLSHRAESGRRSGLSESVYQFGQKGKDLAAESSQPCAIKVAVRVICGLQRGFEQPLPGYTGWALWKDAISKRNFRVRNMDSLSEPAGSGCERAVRYRRTALSEVFEEPAQ